MDTCAFAATRVVNPPGVEPIITEEQLWKGLELKARNPKAFVPMIISSVVTSEDGKNAVREVKFKYAPDVVVSETIEPHEPTVVYFEADTGHRILNIISYGPENELLLTYCFSNGIPSVPSDKPKPNAKELNATMGKNVEGSLVVVRQMVKEGKL
ncbi:DUF1857-domain-containing protein [Mycena rebaudengoi]|nr:DUF1857-domain-containing protein [Mycena rebaudengoi]KAJ7284350.1 DUF1857-domain-containing protein [Mycena rebaudengoi]